VLENCDINIIITDESIRMMGMRVLDEFITIDGGKTHIDNIYGFETQFRNSSIIIVGGDHYIDQSYQTCVFTNVLAHISGEAKAEIRFYYTLTCNMDISPFTPWIHVTENSYLSGDLRFESCHAEGSGAGIPPRFLRFDENSEIHSSLFRWWIGEYDRLGTPVMPQCIMEIMNGAHVNIKETQITVAEVDTAIKVNSGGVLELSKIDPTDTTDIRINGILPILIESGGKVIAWGDLALSNEPFITSGSVPSKFIPTHMIKVLGGSELILHPQSTSGTKIDSYMEDVSIGIILVDDGSRIEATGKVNFFNQTGRTSYIATIDKFIEILNNSHVKFDELEIDQGQTFGNLTLTDFFDIGQDSELYVRLFNIVEHRYTNGCLIDNNSHFVTDNNADFSNKALSATIASRIVCNGVITAGSYSPPKAATTGTPDMSNGGSMIIGN